jgi:DNA-binding transcriptional regulator LsrR (DeoR family)
MAKRVANMTDLARVERCFKRYPQEDFTVTEIASRLRIDKLKVRGRINTLKRNNVIEISCKKLVKKRYDTAYRLVAA